MKGFVKITATTIGLLALMYGANLLIGFNKNKNNPKKTA